jgi:hypothetical protein
LSSRCPFGRSRAGSEGIIGRQENLDVTIDIRVRRRLALHAALMVGATSCASAPRPVPELNFALASHESVEVSAPPPATRAALVNRAAEEASEGEEKNSVGLFLGATIKESETEGSIGVKYERRLEERYGLGVILEYTPDLAERFVTLPALFVHPWRQLSLTLAPGFVTEDSDTFFALRVGGGWDFELGGGFSLAPELNYDFVSGDENALVLGITTAYSF